MKDKHLYSISVGATQDLCKSTTPAILALYPCESYTTSAREIREICTGDKICTKATWHLGESYMRSMRELHSSLRVAGVLYESYIRSVWTLHDIWESGMLWESYTTSVRELYSTRSMREMYSMRDTRDLCERCTVCEICARATRDLWESYTFLSEWHKFYARATRDLRRHYMAYLQELCDSCVRVTSGLDKSYTRSVKELSESYPRCLWELGDLCERYARLSQEVHAASMQELNARCQWERSWREPSRRSAWDHELHEHVPGSVQKLNESSMKAPGKICKVKSYNHDVKPTYCRSYARVRRECSALSRSSYIV